MALKVEHRPDAGGEFMNSTYPLLYRALENIVGSENVTDKDFVLEAYTRDLGTGSEKRPSIVVLPKNKHEISATVRLANRYRVPVYVRGGGTSHVGEWLPIEGGILVDMTKMDRIIDVDTINLTATVEAGCTWHKLYKELRARGLTSDPREIGGRTMTVGASVSKRGSGPIGITKRGRLGWDVLGLEVVLPTGEVIKTAAVEYLGGKPFESGGIGPNLTQFFIGSGGELGIFTEVTLRVSPIPPKDGYIYFNFDKSEGLEKAGDALTMPVGDEYAYSLAFDTAKPWGAGEGKGIDVRVMTCGYSDEILDYRMKKIREICVGAGGREGDPKAAEAYFHRDRGYLWGGMIDFYKYGDVDYYGMGYCPLYSLHKYYKIYEDICIKKYNLTPKQVGFGGWVLSRGWGFYISLRYKDPEERPKIVQRGDEITRMLFLESDYMPWRLGGDINLPLANYAIPRLGAWYEFIRRIKGELDPNRILNPGVMIR
jgi:FAD/FMN-containing dehydrogenase